MAAAAPTGTLPSDYQGLLVEWNEREGRLENELMLYDFFREEEGYREDQPLVLTYTGGLIGFITMDGLDPEPFSQSEYNEASIAIRRAVDNFSTDRLEAEWKGGIWEVMNVFERLKAQAPKLQKPTRDSEALNFMVSETENFWAQRQLFDDRVVWAIHFLPRYKSELNLWSLRKPDAFVSLTTETLQHQARMVKRRLKAFYEDLSAFQTTRPVQGFKPRWLGEQEVFEFLYRTVNRRSTDTKLDPDMTLLTQVAMSTRNNGGTYLEVNSKPTSVLTWKNPPKYSVGYGLRSFPQKCEFPFTIAQTFLSVSSDEKKKFLEGNMPVALGLGQVQRSALVWYGEAQEYLDATQLDGASPFKWKFSMIVQGETGPELQDRVAKANSWIKQIGGAEPLEEDKESRMIAELGSIPGNGFQNQRDNLVTSKNVGDLAFCFGLSRGDQKPHLLFGDRQGGVFGLDLFTPRLTSWNAATLGLQGSGKSLLMNQFLNSLAGYESQIYVLDIGNSYGAVFEFLAQELKGEVGVMRVQGGDFAFNPFPLAWALEEKARQVADGTYRQILPDGEQLPCPVETSKILFEGWIEVLLGQGEPLAPEMKNKLDIALKGRDGKGGFFLDFEQLCDAYLHQMGEHEELSRSAPQPLTRLLTHVRTHAPELEHQLQLWTREPQKKYFDSGLDSVSGASAIYFELTGLDKQKHLVRPFVAALMTTIWRRITDPRRLHEKKIVIIDEAWRFLADPAFAAVIEEMFRTIRKFNGFVVLSTQVPDDLTNPYSIRLLRTMTHQFLYRGFNHPEYFGTHLRLSPHQVELHASIQQDDKVREVFYWDMNGTTRVLRVDIDPIRYWFVTTNADDKGWRTRFVHHFGGIRPAVEKLAEACGGKTIPSSQLRLDKVAEFAVKNGIR
jgi:hypothetical protein